jgi:hypothetical protein
MLNLFFGCVATKPFLSHGLFPLLETIIRHELGVPEDQDVTLSDGSPALQWFAKFMTIPEKQAREIWDAFRNGLLHRAMIKGVSRLRAYRQVRWPPRSSRWRTYDRVCLGFP